MRWKSLCGGLALILATSAGGCKQRLFITSDDYDKYKCVSAANLESSPTIHAEPTLDVPPTPPNVRDPEREIRNITLAECIALALENGTIGQLGGGINDNLVSFAGRGISSPDAIRVQALDPAIIGAGIEASLSKFDAVWTNSMTWNSTDRPSGTPTDRILGGSLEALVQQTANFSTGLVKALPTGGVAGITFSVPFTNTNQQALKNPQYTPQLQFQFEQPLLQGFGVEINQLRAAHPGSILNAGVINTQTSTEGILITRLRFDQQRAQFEASVQSMLVNLEQAYWNLYSAYWTLFSRESAVRQAFEAWKINKARYEAGKISIADFAQTRGQFEQFRGARILALNDVLERERRLREFVGLPIEDGKRLVPADEPTLAPFQPNWEAAARDALALKPELYITRQEVKFNQLNVILAKNQLLPDLRFTSSYDINGIGNRLDGPESSNTAVDNNALRNLASNHFNNWAIGLRMNVPMGFRFAESNLRIARLQLARSYEVLKDQELRALRALQFQYQSIFFNYDLIQARRAEREAFAEQLKARFQEFIAGRGTLDIFLEAQRFWADALDREFQAIRDYNNALVGFEFARGRIMEHDGVVIAEGPVPACAQQRASDHIRERALAIPLRERASAPSVCPDGPPVWKDVPKPGTVPLPSVLSTTPPMKDVPSLPPPEGTTTAPVDTKGTATKPPVPPPSQPAAKPAAPTVMTTSDRGKPLPTPPRVPDELPSDTVLPPSPLPMAREQDR